MGWLTFVAPWKGQPRNAFRLLGYGSATQSLERKGGLFTGREGVAVNHHFVVLPKSAPSAACAFGPTGRRDRYRVRHFDAGHVGHAGMARDRNCLGRRCRA